METIGNIFDELEDALNLQKKLMCDARLFRDQVQLKRAGDPKSACILFTSLI